MSGSRLLAGLAVVSACVALPWGARARGQQAGAAIPPPPPAAWSKDYQELPATGPAPGSAAIPAGPAKGPETAGAPAQNRGPRPVAEQQVLPASAIVQEGNPLRGEVRTLAQQPARAPAADRQEPAVSLEWVGPASIRLGQPAPYQIVARNVGSAPVYEVVVRCPVPEGVSASVSNPAPLTKTSILAWELGTLQPGQERHIDMQLVPLAKTTLDLQATVSFAGVAALRVQVREPKVALRVLAPTQVLAGDSATVTMTVSNPGDGPAEHVKVHIGLPDGLEHPRGRQIEVDLGALAPQEQRTLQLVCSARAPGVQRLDAAVTADGGLKNAAVAPVEVVLPRIDLAAAGPHLRYLERKAVYVFKATNPGSAPASNVTIQAAVPHGMKFRAASGGGQYDPTAAAVSWFVGDLPPGQSREVSLEVVPVNTGDQHIHAVAMAARGLKTETDVLTRVEGLSALLMELADADDPVEVGTDTSYEVRVTNTGSKMETNLQLTCTVPERMELRGARCAAGCRYRVDGRDVIFEPLPRLAPKADVVYRIFVRGTAPGDLRFRARIRADGLSEPVLREESTKVYGDDVAPR